MQADDSGHILGGRIHRANALDPMSGLNGSGFRGAGGTRIWIIYRPVYIQVHQ